MEYVKKLSVKVKLGFGVCDLGGNLYFTVIAFWLLNYLTDTVGIAAGLAGTVIMIGKIWDAVTDPMVGFLSDRTKTRWGRRRPYILFGSFPLCVAMIIMFTTPGFTAQASLFIWAILVFCLLSTAFTVVNIPYSSLTPELTQDYHERTSLNGYRSIFMVFGTLLGAGAAQPIVGAFQNKNTGFSVMGVIFGIVMMITALITFFAVREPATVQKQKRMGFFESFLLVFKNRAFIFILLAFVMQITAVSVFSGILVYYFKYIYLNEQMTTVGLLILLLVTMVFIPISVLVSKRIGKKLTYGIGMLVIVAVAIVIFFLGHTLGMVFFFVMSAIGGIGLSTTYAIPWSMIPDTVEYDYARTGERREGAYYGIWTFTTKIGQAVALGLTGWVLSLTGYVSDIVQSPQTLFGIRLLIGPVTAFIFLTAVIILIFYPINEEKYNQIIAKVREMEAGRAEKHGSDQCL